ncbi:MAG: type I-U CRISPR-associated protein Csb2, partial [Verrucomicrobiota bacterium]|nr:type I-U CRISPR-associated protein Csb2 [Verrucomicrobiota bacterium]
PVPAGLDTYQPEDTGTEILRWVYPGRLAEMVEDFEWSRQYNLARKKSQQEHVFRPLPGPAVRYSKNGHVKPPTPATPFGTDWIVFADEGGNLPELTAFCHVAKTMRDALLGAADNPIPEVLSGHRPDRSPAAAPHIAVIPLGNVGWQHSDGRLVGVGLVIPRNLEQEENRHQPDRLSILRAVGRLEGTPGSPVELTLGKLGVWRLGRRPTPDRSSLEPGRYTRCARRWSSVTSVVLDLFPKDKDGQRVEDVIAKACENIGLPRPAVIWTHKHPAIAGAPSAWPAGGNPPSMDWSFPKGSPLTQKPRIHVTLEFEQEVSGPVILGAGRFQGMGLCLPIDEKKGDHRA